MIPRRIVKFFINPESGAHNRATDFKKQNV